MRRYAAWMVLGATAAIMGCTGGGGDSGTTPITPAPSLAERTAAASATANNNALCTAIAPFHWSMGDSTGRLAQGVTGTGGPDALTTMNIASASKLLYGAWVAEQRAGVLTAEDVKYLTFSSGYTGFSGLIGCLPSQTVAQCVAYQTNGDYTAANDGKFFYNGGHMQKHATLMGLGPDANAALAADISGALGNIDITYSQPQLAGGVVTNATQYGLFLQRTVAGLTRIAGLLGSHPVCTNPATCSSAVSSPIPESWHYSVGHWVENDPALGDGAFSSPGAFGFYPWISADKQWWGIVARHDTALGAAFDSVQCGREIRAAWVSGVAR